MILTKTERIQIASSLGEKLKQKDAKYRNATVKAYEENRWFIEENIDKAVDAICQHFLIPEKLESWAAAYDLDGIVPKKVGVIMAGNIPLVGFHDFLSVFISGHFAMIKLSSKDSRLMKYVLSVMSAIDDRVNAYFEIVERLENFDAVIATGSNNSSRYFEYYFKKVPNIIRKNRNGIAVLTGEESDDDLKRLSSDVFDFFGLGCRNVTKLYVPKAYKFDQLLGVFDDNEKISQHNKYKNNFDYNYALYLLNKEKFLVNNTIILREDPAYISRIACLHYEEYSDLTELESLINLDKELIQCASTSSGDLFNINDEVHFGSTQIPGLADYADGVDTMTFLSSL